MSASRLIELEEARERVLEAAAPLAAESVPLAGTLGRVLAADAVSVEPVPGFDNSAMDGYTVRAADTRGAGPGKPVTLRIVGESRAGHPFEGRVGPGEAIQISTGAAIPAGADAVVRVEETERVEDATVEVRGLAMVRIEAEVAAGNDIRRAGEDIQAGQPVLRGGSRVGPAEIGVLASLGLASVACHRQPRLHVITGGDELIGPGEPMRPGAVRNSNRYAIGALAERAGAELTGNETIPDDREATRNAISAALGGADIVVICGGVSVGEHDHVKAALADLEVEQRFWGIALKPGKPAWFGVRDRALVFGLPGNPVSAMVTFLLLVRPAIEALSGAGPGRYRAIARLARGYTKQPGRTHAIRCTMELRDDGWWAEPAERQGSHVLTSMLGAHCLAILPTEASSFAAGDPVEVELLDLAEPLDEPF